jgi:hypothetical protein
MTGCSIWVLPYETKIPRHHQFNTKKRRVLYCCLACGIACISGQGTVISIRHSHRLSLTQLVHRFGLGLHQIMVEIDNFQLLRGYVTQYKQER